MHEHEHTNAPPPPPFQLFYNNPPAPVLGVPLTALIWLVSGPGFVTLFLAAIRKGEQEADEDDLNFM